MERYKSTRSQHQPGLVDLQTATDTQPPRRASALRAWLLVGFMCLLYALSSIDRLVLVLLVDPISKSLQVGDSEIGLLVGLGFAAVYVLMGLPAAHLVDQGKRRWVLAIGVALWSACTIASGFVTSFPMLFVARAGVAIGEAVLTPVAISVIAESFPRERRSFPTSLYVATGVVMGGGALVFGGLALKFAESLAPRIDLEAWRLTLIIVGLPGMVLAVVAAFCVSDAKAQRTDNEARASVGELLAYLRHRGTPFLAFFCGVGLLSVVLLGVLTWVPALMVRGYGFDAANAGMTLGLLGMPMSFLGTIMAPRIATQLVRRGSGSALVIVAAILAAAGIVSLVAALQTDASELMLVGVAIAVFALSGATVLPAIAIQLFGPQAIRARLMAINLLFLNLLGLGLGPVLISEAAQYFDGPRALGAGISIVAIGALFVMGAVFAIGARKLGEASDNSEGLGGATN